MELVIIDVKGLENTYAVSVFEKEFLKVVNEPWLNKEPFKRYQKKLIHQMKNRRKKNRKCELEWDMMFIN